MIYNYYCILNIKNGKTYIGVTKRDICTRFKEHIRNALNYHDLNNDYIMPILKAIRKYGYNSFDFFLIDSVCFSSFDEAEVYEGSIIKEFNSINDGYNLNYRDYDKRVVKEEVSLKMCYNNSGYNNPFYGKNHTEETKKKLSIIAKDRFSLPENNPMYGKQRTSEEVYNIRMSKKDKAKPFYGDGKKYLFLHEAAVACNVTKQAIYYRLKSDNWKDWFYEGI